MLVSLESLQLRYFEKVDCSNVDVFYPRGITGTLSRRQDHFKTLTPILVWNV